MLKVAILSLIQISVKMRNLIHNMKIIFSLSTFIGNLDANNTCGVFKEEQSIRDKKFQLDRGSIGTSPMYDIGSLNLAVHLVDFVGGMGILGPYCILVTSPVPWILVWGMGIGV